jgi:hypothetical protein
MTSSYLLCVSALLACVLMVASAPHSSTPVPSSSASPAPFVDTQCEPVRFTYEGMARTEEFKPRNLGWFNCSGSITYYDPLTAHQVSYVPLPWFNLSTTYESECGCYVTRTDGTPTPVYEYGIPLGGRADIGTCFEFDWPQTDGSVIHSVASVRTVNRLHRDVTYVDKSSGRLVYHQTYYLAPNRTEIVLVRGLDPVHGTVTFLQSMVCYQIAAQAGP